jgi:hypothetical protein
MIAAAADRSSHLVGGGIGRQLICTASSGEVRPARITKSGAVELAQYGIRSTPSSQSRAHPDERRCCARVRADRCAVAPPAECQPSYCSWSVPVSLYHPAEFVVDGGLTSYGPKRSGSGA